MIISCKIAICLAMALASLKYADSSAIGRPRSIFQDPSFSASRHQRSRRSADENDDDNDGEKKEAFSTEQLAGYRFSDDFFTYPTSGETAEATAETEISRLINDDKTADGCERVFRDSMICMVCNDPGKNSKYEQCSYVARPNDKIRSYTSSRTSGNDDTAAVRENAQDDEEKRETSPYGRYSKEADDEDEGEKAYSSGESYASRESAPSSLSYRSEQPKSIHGHQNYREDHIRDKLNDYDDRLGQSSYESAYLRSPSSAEITTGSNDDGGSTSDEVVPRSSQKANRKRSQCQEIQKDSMTCTICSDPENGGNFEKCSYKHQPNDKLYKFSKSKRFGYPVDSETSPEETRSVSSVANHGKSKNPRCRKIRKDSTTLCNVCEDTNGRERSEQCEYNVKADEPSSRRVSRNVEATTRS